jgi:hypothetical protein
MTKKTLALVKIADPEKGVTREEYEAVCAALGLKPKPPKSTVADSK